MLFMSSTITNMRTAWEELGYERAIEAELKEKNT
jgi:hypothetical protein